MTEDARRGTAAWRRPRLIVALAAAIVALLALAACGSSNSSSTSSGGSTTSSGKQPSGSAITTSGNSFVAKPSKSRAHSLWLYTHTGRQIEQYWCVAKYGKRPDSKSRRWVCLKSSSGLCSMRMASRNIITC